MRRTTTLARTHRTLSPEERPHALNSTVPGRLLDALVAVDVLLETVSLEDPDNPRYRTDAGAVGYRVPKFSTDPKALRLVYNRLAATLCAIDVGQLPDGSWRCTITPPRGFEAPPVTWVAATEPLAVCLAARRVLRPHAAYPRVLGLDDWRANAA